MKSNTNGRKRPIFTANNNTLKKALLWGGLTLGAAATAFGLNGNSPDVHQYLANEQPRIQQSCESYAPNQTAYLNNNIQDAIKNEKTDGNTVESNESAQESQIENLAKDSERKMTRTDILDSIDLNNHEVTLLEQVQQGLDKIESQSKQPNSKQNETIAPPTGYQQHMPTNLAQEKEVQKNPVSDYDNKNVTEWEKGEFNKGMMWDPSKTQEGKLTLSPNSLLEDRLRKYDDNTHMPQVALAVDKNNDGIIENIDLNNDGKYDKEGELQEIFVKEYKPGEKTTFDIGEPIELQPEFKDIDNDGELENINRMFAGYVVTSEIVNHDSETVTKKSSWQASYDNSGSYATAKTVAQYLDVEDYDSTYENFMNQTTGQFIDKYTATETDDGLKLHDSEGHILAFMDKTLSEKEQFKELTDYFAGVNEHGADSEDFEQSFSEYYDNHPEIAEKLASKVNTATEQLPSAEKIASALEKNLYPEYNGITPLDKAYHNIESMNNGSHELGKPLEYIATETYTQEGQTKKSIFGPTDKMQDYLASLQGGN